MERVGAVGVWLTVTIDRHYIKNLKSRIATLQLLSHELIIDDPSKIVVATQEALWVDQNRWKVSLPEGKYHLHLATRGIDEAGLAIAIKNADLSAGIHPITLEREKTEADRHISVLSDGTELIVVDELLDWDPATGWNSGGDTSNSRQLPADKPVVLFRKRFFCREMLQVSPRNSMAPVTEFCFG